jgi:hypothetical protein
LQVRVQIRLPALDGITVASSDSAARARAIFFIVVLDGCATHEVRGEAE